jgi:hypothetical protein
MKDNTNKKLRCLFVIISFLMATLLNYVSGNTSTASVLEDYDPLVDVSVTLNIKAIRSLESNDSSSSDFYVKVNINNEKFTSPIWHNKDYLYPDWYATVNVPDDIEHVYITIELWDHNDGRDVLCDINSNHDNPLSDRYVSLVYSIKKGSWTGDDFLGDMSGYGRLNGCDDGSIYSQDRDCEMWFSLTQNDYDKDGLSYWTELMTYGTDPFIDNTGEDYDGDGIPIEWEHKWGFNPLSWEDHMHLDGDNDSLTNTEEYLTRLFGSDPFRQDLFLELDFMKNRNNHSVNIVSQDALELLKNPFHRRNIIFFINIDEFFPFDDLTNQTELLDIYQTFFLSDTENMWKRSVFHYGIFVHDCIPTGYSYAGDGPVFWGYIPGTNGFIVSQTQMEKYNTFRPDISLDYFHASVIMHEIGHHFGIRFGNPYGCDNHFGKYPWQISYWIFGNYKSVMNYRYTYQILDYSDGSHGKRDFNDWEYMNLSYFEINNSVDSDIPHLKTNYAFYKDTRKSKISGKKY